MRERNLVFDRNKHLMFSGKVKKVMQKELLSEYTPKEAQMIWEKLEDCYETFLKDLPYIGGKKNMQAGSVYDCIALFAYYEVLEEKPSVKKMEELCCALFVPKRQSPAKMTWPFAPRLAHMIFSRIAKNGKKHEREWPGNYHMEVKPYEKGKGTRYIFSTCPIADFAKAHGYEHLMPAMCNPDYPTLAKIHASLIRRSTCGNGSCCDFWVLPENSPYLNEYLLLKSPEGFLYNRPKNAGRDEQFSG